MNYRSIHSLLSPWQSALLTLMLVAGAYAMVENSLREQDRRDQEIEVLNRLSTVRARLEGLINGNLLLARGLGLLITTRPEIEQAEFARAARELMHEHSVLRSVGAAPDLVIRLIYPLEGNEAAFGLDFRTHPEQGEAALKAVETGKLVVAGPVQLVQGYEGFVARAAVYLPDEANGRRLWGLISVVLDAQALYRHAGLGQADLDIQVAIRGRDASGASGEVFFGPPELFDYGNTHMDVALPHGSWRMAAAPLGGWNTLPDSLVYTRTLAAVLGLLAAVMAFFSARDSRARESNALETLRLTHHLQALYQASPDMIFLHGPDGRVLEVNDNACTRFGYAREEMLSAWPERLTGSGCSARQAHEWLRQAFKGESPEFEWMGRDARGGEFPMEVRLRLLHPEPGDVARVLAVVRDIGPRKREEAALLASEQRLTDAIESIAEGFALWDREDRLRMCNSRFREIFHDMGQDPCNGILYRDFIHQALVRRRIHIGQARQAWIDQRLAEHRESGGGYEVQTDRDRWLQVSERRTEEGGVVSIYSDITDLRQAEENLRFRAFFDPLTHLPNRTSFTETLELAVLDTRREPDHFALLFIDLDRFKHVNDALGHPTGDLLLREAAQRIADSVRESDTVARLGGDEFTVLLRHLNDDLHASIVADSIIEALTRPYHLNGHEVYTGASIGITVCPTDGGDTQTLLRNADMAMFQAKDQGRNTFRYFTRQMTERARRFVSVEKDLRHALHQNQLLLHYQPVIRSFGGQMSGAEALVRWQHPEKGLVFPGDFIPVAEETRLIIKLGEWVLREACRQAARWTANGGLPPYLTVNVSSQQFRGGFGASLVREILEDSGFPPQRLVFEITESLLMDEDERVRQALHAFRDMGVGLAVDDFGTGYSSLSYLRRFPVTAVKVDKSFVRDMEQDPADARLVETIIGMAHSMQMLVVAEGVETEGQARLLRERGCDLMQGFLFSRPLPAADFLKHLLGGAAPDRPRA